MTEVPVIRTSINKVSAIVGFDNRIVIQIWTYTWKSYIKDENMYVIYIDVILIHVDFVWQNQGDLLIQKHISWRHGFLIVEQHNMMPIDTLIWCSSISKSTSFIFIHCANYRVYCVDVCCHLIHFTVISKVDVSFFQWKWASFISIIIHFFINDGESYRNITKKQNDYKNFLSMTYI